MLKINNDGHIWNVDIKEDETVKDSFGINATLVILINDVNKKVVYRVTTFTKYELIDGTETMEAKYIFNDIRYNWDMYNMLLIDDDMRNDSYLGSVDHEFEEINDLDDNIRIYKSRIKKEKALIKKLNEKLDEQNYTRKEIRYESYERKMDYKRYLKDLRGGYNR